MPSSLSLRNATSGNAEFFGSPSPGQRICLSPSSLLIFRDDPEGPLISIDRLTQYIAERLGVFRACNDPCMDGRPFALLVCLPQVEHEFKSVVADLEVVCITTFQPPPPFALVAFRLHGDGAPVKRLGTGCDSSALTQARSKSMPTVACGAVCKTGVASSVSLLMEHSPPARNGICHRECDTSLS